MVGQGVLRECLLDPEVQSVLAIGRSAAGRTHAKLRELVHHDFTDFSSIEAELVGCDACFYCLGVSAAGLKEADYLRITYDFTLAAAQALVKKSPQATFVYVSGAGTDGTEKGRSFWARVKGRTENALLQLPFKAKFMFRPGIIRPLHGIQSKTPLYRTIYAVIRPLWGPLRAMGPKWITSTEEVGKAMLAVAKRGAPKTWLENSDINALAAG
jgi:uncharacterized protein YbjT (DUF2867 family)